ncbi:HepT-like ribonuclease domain-containing protein [Rhodohalobacter sulfatireducens]|uniref:HepT-like ribonuclease domain-containing protein n=1 Tax=Rhodohalobacter sulfatireducens TaxID=2911366 RepID=UPI002101E640|nr:HepT-like ribonuclease domain-containing protein [Rhodohalobacter sulfatireducens]
MKTQSAVIRQFEVMGEAVKKLDKELTNQYSDTDWTAIAGMRDLLIHQYFGVDLDLVWESVTEDLPKFKKTMMAIKKQLE